MKKRTLTLEHMGILPCHNQSKPYFACQLIALVMAGCGNITTCSSGCRWDNDFLIVNNNSLAGIKFLPSNLLGIFYVR